jgi:hypothetical protein
MLFLKMGLKLTFKKIEAVRDWPTPVNAKELKSFLGLAAYYMRFVDQFSNIAKPLYTLCSKSHKLVWAHEHEQAFQSLQISLTTAPILAYPRSDLPCYRHRLLTLCLWCCSWAGAKWY